MATPRFRSYAKTCDPDLKMPWSIVARYSSIGEAEAARSALRAAGVDAFLADENIVAIDWLYANAVGAVKLMARDEDRDRAARVLAGESIEDPAANQTEAVAEDTAVRCPECSSSEIARVPRLRLFLFLAVVLAAVGYAVEQPDLALAGIVAAALIVALARSHRCPSCGHRWNAIEPEPERDEAPPPDPSDTVDQPCPRCGSLEVHRIDYRRLKAIPMLVNVAILVLLPIWIFLPKRQCDQCGLKI